MPHVPLLSLERRRPGRIQPGLDRIRQALDLLGRPQESFHSILVVGTNGKGSTALLTSTLLQAHGVTTGLYTSPHLLHATERITIAGRPISPRQLESLTRTLDRFPELTFFETLTAASFLAFAEAGVDVAVLEAGMGGRWDATRAAASVVCGLTNIGTDHGGWLGRERDQIAQDKGSAVAAARLGVLGPGVDEEIREHLGAPNAVPAQQLVRLEHAGGSMLHVSWNGAQTGLSPPLTGAHQIDNLHLALAITHGAAQTGLAPDLDPLILTPALSSVRWPARLSQHRIMGREILLDGAHNLEAAAALARYLKTRDERFNLLFSALNDKPIEAMAATLQPVVGSVVVCPLDDERSATPDRLLRAFPEARCAATPLAALRLLDDPVVAAGSLRLAGALLEHAPPEEAT